MRPIRRLESNTVFVGFTATCGFRDGGETRTSGRRRNGRRARALAGNFRREKTPEKKDSSRPRNAHLVLRGVADEPLGVREGDVGRGRAVALIVRDDLDAARREGVSGDVSVARRGRQGAWRTRENERSREGSWLRGVRRAHRSFCHTPTQVYVVPRSMPTATSPCAVMVPADAVSECTPARGGVAPDALKASLLFRREIGTSENRGNVSDSLTSGGFFACATTDAADIASRRRSENGAR